MYRVRLGKRRPIIKESVGESANSKYGVYAPEVFSWVKWSPTNRGLMPSWTPQPQEFDSEEEAQELVDKLSENGYKAKIEMLGSNTKEQPKSSNDEEYW
jgi:hypothetical protein